MDAVFFSGKWRGSRQPQGTGILQHAGFICHQPKENDANSYPFFFQLWQNYADPFAVQQAWNNCN